MERFKLYFGISYSVYIWLLNLIDSRYMKIAVIFDMDGVIVDNGMYHIDAFRELCRRYSIEFSEEEFRKCHFGRVNEEILPDLFNRKLNDSEVAGLAEEKEALYREIYKPHINAAPGLLPLLKELKVNDIPVGVATSAPVKNVDFVLDSLKIREYVDVVVDDSMVRKGKPDPEIYIKAASLLQVIPGNCIIFEDSLSGTRAAF